MDHYNLPTTLANAQALVLLYSKYTENYPGSTTAWYAKGLALTRLRRYEEAINCFDRVLAIEKNHTTAWYAKGLLAFELANYEYAINCFDRVLAIEKNHTTAWYAKGLALTRLRRYEEAINCFDRAIKRDPQAAGAFRKHTINVKTNK
jgi:tetratricopeptide (TPR) repeat protein